MHFKHVFKLSPRGKNGRNKLIGRPFTCLRILGISFQSAVVARGYLILYWKFLVGHRRRALLSSVLWTVYYFDFSSVDVNEIHFTVNYLSSQFTSKVLSKRLLKNSICSLFWVFSEASWTTALLFWTLALFIRPTWRIHLQSGIPPKSRQLGSDGESGRTYTPAHVDLQAKYHHHVFLQWRNLILSQLLQVILNQEACTRSDMHLESV